MRGLFITFEGIEGVGKSTQIQILADKLRQLECKIVVLREPGGTPVGEEIRHTLKHSAANTQMAPETELLLMNASRAQLVREVIRPALDRGEIVLCDRFSDSTIAYQGYGRGLDLRTVKSIVEFAVGGLSPDLSLLLSLPISLSEARRAERAESSALERDRFEEEDSAFFARAAEGYGKLAAAEPKRIMVIDGAKSIEAVHLAIWAVVEPMIRDELHF